MLMNHSYQDDEKHQGGLNKGKFQLNLLQHQKMNIVECTLKHLILQLLVFVVGLTRKVLKSLVMFNSYYSRYAVQNNEELDIDVVHDFFYDDFSKEDCWHSY